jgi:hypothetical protein
MQLKKGHFAFGLLTLAVAVVTACGGSSDDDNKGPTAGSSGTSSGSGGKGTAGSASPGGTTANTSGSGNNTSGGMSNSSGSGSGGSAPAGGSFAGGGFPTGGFGNFSGLGGDGPSFPGIGGDGSIDVNTCPDNVDTGSACTYVDGGILENVCQGNGVYCACMMGDTYQCFAAP